MLLDHQKKAIDKLHQLKVGALFMEAGTGKTLTAYTLIKNTKYDYVIWFTPFRTKENLSNEIIKNGGLNNLEIVGIESIQNSDRLYLKLFNMVNKHNCFLVVDESIKIKNIDAKRTKRLYELSKYCEYKLILNGTPLTRNILDLYPQINLLSPKILNMDFAEYKNTFCEYITIIKRLEGNKPIKKEFIIEYHNLEYLYSKIEKYIFECDLFIANNKIYIDIKYNLTIEEKEQYNLLKEKYLDNELLLLKRNNIFLEMTTKMQHNYCCSNEKIEKLKYIIEKHKNENILIFTKFIKSRELLKKIFPNIKILNYQMHAYGLNLQDYNVTIYFDKTFNYAELIQSENRTYRTGQKKDCYYYSLTGDVGLENIIKNNIAKKKTLLQYFKEISLDKIKEDL